LQQKNGTNTLVIVILAIVCFAQFCAIMWFGLRGQTFGLSALTYQDFLTAIFTAVTLILSMLAIMLGIMAFVGWQGFQSNVQRLTHKFIREGFDQGGEFREILKDEVDAIATSGISTIYDEEEQK